MNFRTFLNNCVKNNEPVFLDGGMGTMLQNSAAANYSIPEEVNCLDCGFYSSIERETIEIPSTITELRCLFFSKSQQLNHITFPDSIISLKEKAFKNCESLSSVQLSTNLVELTKSEKAELIFTLDSI